MIEMGHWAILCGFFKNFPAQSFLVEESAAGELHALIINNFLMENLLTPKLLSNIDTFSE